VVVKWPKVGATILLALGLATSSHAQQAGQSSVPEFAAANAFERTVQGEGGRSLKRIYTKRLEDLCATDDRRWGSGIVGYGRVSFVSEHELDSKMLTLVRQWKTTGSQNPSFDASDFPKLRRYAVASCGIVGGQTKVVVAV
jgi:hypothetical protein